MMRDPYDVLGVPKSASDEDVKKAWRSLAKRHHPDRNANDPQAAARLAEVNQAYDIVGDKEKRARFDRGEIDAQGKPRFQSFEGFGAGRPGGFAFDFDLGGARAQGPARGPRPGGPDPSDVFSDLFGAFARGHAGRSPQPSFARGEDISATLKVSLAEAARGGTRRVRLAGGRELEVTVPPGSAAGKTLRLRGAGQPAPGGGEAGDAILTLEIEPDPRFEVDGADLRAIVPVTLDEAVLGARIRVPTLEGQAEVAIPPGSNGGRTLRLKGKGLPGPGGAAGDLYVSLRIVLPEGDEDLRRLAEDIRAHRPYGVRDPG